MTHPNIGDDATVIVEIARGSFTKRRSDGGLDYGSPVPLPFNYGAVEDVPAEDGDWLDAIVLGDRLEVGTRHVVPIRAIYPFVDGGQNDPKLICSPEPLTPQQRRRLRRFFWWFSSGKWWLNLVRGRRGRTGGGALIE